MLFSLLPAALDAFLFYRLTDNLLRFRFSKKLHTLPGVTAFFLLLMRFFLFVNHEDSPYFIPSKLVVIVLVLAFTIVYYEDSLKKKLGVFLLFTLVLMLTEGVVICMILAVSGDVPFNEILQIMTIQQIATYFSKLLGFFLVEAISIRFNKTASFSLSYTKELSFILVYNLILFCSMVYALLSEPIISRIDNDIMLAVCVNVFFISILSALLIIKVAKRSKKEMHYQLELQQMELENQANEDLNLMLGKMRSFRHDLNNHLGVMSGLVKQNQIDDLADYLDSIANDLFDVKNYMVFENKALTVLINNKMAKTYTHDIAFHPTIQVESLPLSDLDLCTLLGNIIDNAIDACLQVDEDPYIDLSIQKRGSQYLIRCVNPYKVAPIMQGHRFLTTKDNQKIHGIGLQNIRHIIEKYNGELDISYSEQLFTIDAMIQAQ